MSMTAVSAPRRARWLVRGWSVATLATFGGAASHAAAGGHAPGPALLAVCWALSGVLCVLVSAVRVSAGATALGVLGSQALLHGLFAQTGHTVVLSAAGTAASGASGASGAAGHLGHGSGTLAAAVWGHAHTMTPAMVALHLVAAALTFLAIRRGETALAAIARAVRLGLERFVALAEPTLPVPAFRSPAPVRELVRPLASQAFRGPVALRGPPRLFVSA